MRNTKPVKPCPYNKEINLSMEKFIDYIAKHLRDLSVEMFGFKFIRACKHKTE